MSREMTEKAARFVKERKVAVFTNEEELVEAEVRGIHDTYLVVFNPGDQWTCTCKAGEHGYRCSHVEAVGMEMLRRHDEELPV